MVWIVLRATTVSLYLKHWHKVVGWSYVASTSRVLDYLRCLTTCICSLTASAFTEARSPDWCRFSLPWVLSARPTTTLQTLVSEGAWPGHVTAPDDRVSCSDGGCERRTWRLRAQARESCLHSEAAQLAACRQEPNIKQLVQGHQSN